VKHKSRRVIKKRRKRLSKMETLVARRGREYAVATWPARQKLRDSIECSCDFCGGMGSREAYLDSIWQELLEKEADEHGLFVTSGEGDPCDIFVGECRDKPEDEESEDDEVDNEDGLVYPPYVDKNAV
ncbi:MAG: hypothetical protein ACREGR_02785, partial [Minisyncoccia bacterium]